MSRAQFGALDTVISEDFWSGFPSGLDPTAEFWCKGISQTCDRDWRMK